MTERKEDKPLVGDILNANGTRDLPDFTNYSDRFDEDYFLAHKAKITEVRNLPKVEVKTGQNKKFTEDLYKQADSLREPMRFLEGYVKHAGELLDVQVKSFGIHEVRECLKEGDLEALSGDLAVVNENIENNKTVLLNEGLKQTTITALIDLKAAIDEQNAQQEVNKEARNLLVEANDKVYAELDALNDDILDVGKRIYKGVSQAKYDDYVLTKIMARIRHTGGGGAPDVPPVS